jgi:hypothetical protein
MGITEPAALPEFEASFGAVEAALVAAYAIAPKARGAFRGRITALQKQGLLGAANRPGRGHALTYRWDQFTLLVFAIEMLEAGVSPAAVLALVKERGDRLRKIFRDAQNAADHDHGPTDVVVAVAGTLMTSEWSSGVPAVNSFPLHKLDDHMRLLMKSDDPRLPARSIILNLSQALRRFHSALAVSFLDEALSERRKLIKGKR